MTGIILAIFLGWAGGYRFYKRQYGMGILYLCTGGLFCFGWIYDIIMSIKEKDVDWSKVAEYKKRANVYLSDAYYEFEDKYYNQVERWEIRIDDIDTYDINPDKTLEKYAKKRELCLQFKDFCESKPGGAEYYADQYSNMIPDLDREIERYKKDEYANDMKYYQEELAAEKEDEEHKKLIKATEKELLKHIKSGVSRQTDLQDKLSGEMQTVFSAAIYNLMADNKISKSHENNRVIYTIVS